VQIFKYYAPFKAQINMNIKKWKLEASQLGIGLGYVDEYIDGAAVG